MMPVILMKQKKEMLAIFNGKATFDTPKPRRLLEYVLTIAGNQDTLILDSFAGSGTTAHAVLNMNKADGGNRKFILVEMMDYAGSITAERVKRVIDGYGEGTKKPWKAPAAISVTMSWGLCFCCRTATSTKKQGRRKSGNTSTIWRLKSLCPPDSPRTSPYFMGLCRNTAYYFYYERERVTTLDYDFLAAIQTKAEGYTIYADLCAIPQETLRKHNITFKKIPGTLPGCKGA